MNSARSNKPNTNLNFDHPTVGELIYFIKLFSDKFRDERNLELACKVLECLAFIKLNFDWIRYAIVNKKTDLSIYKYPADIEKQVLRAHNDMSFHVISYDDPEKALKDYSEIIHSVEAGLKSISNNETYIKMFIGKIRDSDVGCLEHRLAPALDFLLDPSIVKLDDLFQDFFDRLEKQNINPENISDLTTQLIETFQHRLGEIVLYKDKTITLTWDEIKNYLKVNYGYENEFDLGGIFQHAIFQKYNGVDKDHVKLYFNNFKQAEKFLKLIIMIMPNDISTTYSLKNIFRNPAVFGYYFHIPLDDFTLLISLLNKNIHDITIAENNEFILPQFNEHIQSGNLDGVETMLAIYPALIELPLYPTRENIVDALIVNNHLEVLKVLVEKYDIDIQQYFSSTELVDAESHKEILAYLEIKQTERMQFLERETVELRKTHSYERFAQTQFAHTSPSLYWAYLNELSRQPRHQASKPKITLDEIEEKENIEREPIQPFQKPTPLEKEHIIARKTWSDSVSLANKFNEEYIRSHNIEMKLLERFKKYSPNHPEVLYSKCLHYLRNNTVIALSFDAENIKGRTEYFNIRNIFESDYSYNVYRLYIFSQLPKFKPSYVFSFILVSDGLYFVDKYFQFNKVPIDNFQEFVDQIKKLNSQSFSKINLTHKQVKELITANGGYQPSVIDQISYAASYVKLREEAELALFDFLPESYKKIIRKNMHARPRFAALRLLDDNNPLAATSGYGNSYLVLRNILKYNCLFLPEDSVLSRKKNKIVSTFHHLELLMWQMDDTKLSEIVQKVQTGFFPADFQQDLLIDQGKAGYIEVLIPTFNYFDANFVEHIRVDPIDHQMSEEEINFLSARGITVDNSPSNQYAQWLNELMQYIDTDDVDKVNSLVETHPSLIKLANSQANPPLQIASKQGCKQVLSFWLTKFKFDLSADEMVEALYAAVTHNQLEAVILLIPYLLDRTQKQLPDLLSQEVGSKGHTYLEAALINNTPDTIEFLLKKGASINRDNIYVLCKNNAVFKYFLERLLIAISKKDLETFLSLTYLNKSLFNYPINSAQDTVLMYMVHCNFFPDANNILSDPQIDIMKRNKRNETLLSKCAQVGDFSNVDLILKSYTVKNISYKVFCEDLNFALNNMDTNRFPQIAKLIAECYLDTYTLMLEDNIKQPSSSFFGIKWGPSQEKILAAAKALKASKENHYQGAELANFKDALSKSELGLISKNVRR